MVCGHQSLHVLAQVVPQVPPVGDLHRVGRTVRGRRRRARRSVPADDLHTGVGASDPQMTGGNVTQEANAAAAIYEI